MKILVTGTAGFIGYHVAKRLLLDGHQVVGLDNLNDYYDTRVKYGRLAEAGILQEPFAYGKIAQSLTSPSYQFIQLNLQDKEAIIQLFASQQFDSVCHLAAQAGVRYSIANPSLYVDSNIVGFANILEACRHYQVQSLTYASSSSVYGLNTTMPFATADPTNHPISIYAASKRSNELMAHSYSHIFGLPTTGLRFFTVYGPWGRPDMAIFLFTRAILEGKPIEVFNDGLMLRDFTYIDDIVEGVVRVMIKPATPDPLWDAQHPTPASSSAPFRIFNLGNNNPVQLIDFIQAIENALGKKAIKHMMPLQLGDVPGTYANVEPLMNYTGFKPCTSLQYGVDQFVAWYKSFYKA